MSINYVFKTELGLVPLNTNKFKIDLYVNRSLKDDEYDFDFKNELSKTIYTNTLSRTPLIQMTDKEAEALEEVKDYIIKEEVDDIFIAEELMPWLNSNEELIYQTLA